MSTIVYPFDKLAEEGRSLAGGKGGTLSQLYQSGYPVPEGFGILPDAFDSDALTDEAWEQVKSHLDLFQWAPTRSGAVTISIRTPQPQFPQAKPSPVSGSRRPRRGQSAPAGED